MNTISGPEGLPHSRAEMVRPSGVFTPIGLCFSACAMTGCAMDTSNAANPNPAKREIVMATSLWLPRRYHLAGPSGRRTEGRADLLERLALGVHADEGGDNGGGAHERRGE